MSYEEKVRLINAEIDRDQRRACRVIVALFLIEVLGYLIIF